MNQTLKNILFVFISLIFSFVLVAVFNKFYLGIFLFDTSIMFNVYDVSLRLIIGVCSVYISLIAILFIPFGGAKKYWWIGALLIPAMAFELYFNLAHIYIPLGLSLLGWGIGFGISKLMKKQV